jgi:hypothetical protein
LTHAAELEVCVVAAIRLPDGVVVEGKRHHLCFERASMLGYSNVAIRASTQGFVTNRLRFVGRKEGQRLQLAAGVESVDPGGYRGDILFSEDLY